MSKTLTVSASVATAYYSTSASWHNNGTQAYQGFYTGTTYSRVGVISFGTLGTQLKGKKIESITLNVTVAAGTNNSKRTITFWSSNYQSIDTTKTGASYPKTQLGVLTGNGNGLAYSTANGDRSYVFDPNTSAAVAPGLFEALATRLTAGDTTFIIYNGETSLYSSYSYSQNYLSVKNVSMTITYSEYGLVYIGNGSGFDAYTVHVHNGTGWEQYAPYIHNGTTWELHS